jgi:UDP-N-acetylmuramyl pentapeptide phosphotransferase/UDP-N-acetylglucosamine-1-phosphate transferase
MAVAANTKIADFGLAVLPLVPSFACFLFIKDGDNIKTSIACSFVVSAFAFGLTDAMIPGISQYLAKRNITGKDMGKKGTERELTEVPEGLGIVSGIVFLICAIVTQLLFARSAQQLVVYNSGLFSVCFMIFLGYLDDTLDLKVMHS